MASISLHEISKSWGAGKATLEGINLEIADGELLVLVGPSGCGKSTLLRMIAGLEEISSGELLIDGKLANDIPPAQRGLAMVFQSYALYPHMNVFDNMGFALKMAGKDKAEIKRRVEAAADVLQIRPLLDRKPGQLSGGQRQRVAIGRAIVREPKVFLFDEPLSNLDASLRLQMRLEISRLHQSLKSTMVYVTHDQVEAMTLGQRIVVLRAGHIEQVGTPQELYEKPDNLFVAGFLGTPTMNFLPATQRSYEATACWQIACGEAQLDLPFDARSNQYTANEGKPDLREQALCIGIRPEQCEILPAPSAELNLLAAHIAHIEYLGDAAQVYVQVAHCPQLICVRQASQAQAWRPSMQVWLRLAANACHLFDAQGVALRHATGQTDFSSNKPAHDPAHAARLDAPSQAA